MPGWEEATPTLQLHREIADRLSSITAWCTDTDLHRSELITRAGIGASSPR